MIKFASLSGTFALLLVFGGSPNSVGAQHRLLRGEDNYELQKRVLRGEADYDPTDDHGASDIDKLADILPFPHGNLDPTEPFVNNDPSVADLEKLAPRLNTSPENVAILNQGEASFPFLNGTYRFMKTYDTKTGDSHRLVLNDEDELVDYDALLEESERARSARYGAMNDALSRKSYGADPDEKIEVMIQMKIPERQSENDRDFETQGRSLAAAEERASMEIADIEARAKSAYAALQDKYGLADDKDGDDIVSGPFLFIRVTASKLRELAKDDTVAFMGLDGGERVLDNPTIAQSLKTTKTNTVHNWGYDGEGVKVAVLEWGKLWKPQSCFNIGAVQITTGSASSHMTKSLGILGNRYNAGSCSGSNWEGYAPKAKVYVANNNDYKKAYAWAKGKGVNIVTMSWHFGNEETSGSLHSRDKYFDYWATKYPYPTIFTSAGNGGAAGEYASGKGYNILGVGNVKNDGDGNRNDDVMEPSTSFKNPTTGWDREVPDIAAPGSRHAVLGSSFGGTSCATPVSAGIAAVVMDRNPSLKYWPEAMRAILMATANYQDADGSDFSQWSDGKDGAGLLNTYYAVLTAGKRNNGSTASYYRAHDYGSFSASSFGSDGYMKKTWKIYTSTANAHIRVAFAWHSTTTSVTSDNYNVDLDVQIYKGSTLVAGSYTWSNTFEFVEFKPPSAGVFTIKVKKWSFPSSFLNHYGLGYTVHYD